MPLPSRVKIVEVSPRDGLQNEKEFVPTDVKIELVNRLCRGGFSQYRSHVLRLRQMGAPDGRRGPRSWPASRASRASSISVLTPNMKGFDAARAGRDGRGGDLRRRQRGVFPEEHQLLDRRIDRALRTAWRAAAKAAELRCAVPSAARWDAPYQGEVPVESVVGVARRYLALGCDEIDVADTIGVGTPRSACGKSMAAVSAVVDPARVSGHFHDTYGQALANILAALEQRHRDFPYLGRGAGRLSLCQGRDRQCGNRRRAVSAARPGHRYRRRLRCRRRYRPVDLRPSASQVFQPLPATPSRPSGRPSIPGRRPTAPLRRRRASHELPRRAASSISRLPRYCREIGPCR